MQLLGSFIAARSEYALARLECAMHSPELPPPPVVDRLTDASETSLKSEWGGVERQLEAALVYVKRIQRTTGRAFRNDAAYRALDRAVREMDQYARAIRWVQSVTESEDI